ncbi:MAG: hypothetical protein ABIX01_13745 [Chitinophagaceae bacterium]
MELVLEISEEKLKELDIQDTRITFEQLQAKMMAKKMIEALEKTQAAAKEYGIDKWSEEEIINLVEEAKTNDASNKTGY